MIRQVVIVSLLLFFCQMARSQKVIDSLARESCNCIGKISVTSPGGVPEDSITNCISRAMISHFDELMKEKKLNPGTVEGIVEINKRVRKTLAKECEYLKNRAEGK